MEQTSKNEFAPPRHWVGVEELTPEYWADPLEQEKRSQEFYDKPIETIDKIDRLDKKGLARRDFLTLMGASMAMASFSCARRPVNKIIPYVVKPEEILPGVSTFYSSTCPETGLGLLVKTREGRPVKLEGNPDHPMNHGSLSAQGQAVLLNLYDPDRIKAPFSRARGTKGHRDLDWKAVDTEVLAKLKAIASGSGRVRVLSYPVLSPSTHDLIQTFLSCFSSAKHVAYQPIGDDDAALASSISFGTASQTRVHFDRADVVVALGSDFLGSGPNSVEDSSLWAKRRKLHSKDAAKDAGAFSKLYSFESTFSLTGANADERAPILPGDEFKIALAIAHDLAVRQKVSRFAADGALVGLLSAYKPETVEKETGVSAALIAKAAHDLWVARGKGAVVTGGLATQTRNGVKAHLAVNLLNAMLENEGQTVALVSGLGVNAKLAASNAAFAQLVEEMKAGQVDALIIWGTNPAYTAPDAVTGFDQALSRVGLVVRVGTHDDETALLSDFVLPEHHFLENWGDAEPRAGVLSVQQPVIAPIHSTRAFQDTLLAWMKSGSLSPKGAEAVTAAKDWHGYLKSRWEKVGPSQVGSNLNGEAFWEESLRRGVWAREVNVSARSFSMGATVSKLSGANEAAPSGPSLVLYSKISMGDGRNANNAWLQEMPDPISSNTWDNYLNVSKKIAEDMKLRDDDVVRVTVGSHSVELPVKIQPGMHAQTVSAAIGYGRRSCGRVADGCGQDVYPLALVEGGRRIFSGILPKLEKTGRRYHIASTQWHFKTENRPIINDITLAEFKKNPAKSSHTDPHMRMESVPTLWTKHNYTGYRWGMAIDLNSCTGCGACVVACQAENNIPVVGRDQVRVSRQMHWIRIDRYYSGDDTNPKAVFQPMLCQHCENAPCETVCPVLATVHDNEGLNVQVYNRCVGTRYCQNNCPYKVRRFNFFDHWKQYEGPMNLVWNPDITVRTRGIMEKCTFCTQRIRAAKDTAKDQSRKVKDGEIRPACAQTCPTDAILFGDINDPTTRVAQASHDPMAFRVLEVLNTVPAISYMTKVRNAESVAHDHHQGEEAPGGEEHEEKKEPQETGHAFFKLKIPGTREEGAKV